MHQNTPNFRAGTGLISLLILFFLLFSLGLWFIQKKPKAPLFQIGLGCYSTGVFLCSSSKYASIDGLGFSIWRRAFEMAAITGHYVISCRKVLPPGECWRSVCPVHMQQRSQLLIR